MGGGDLNLKKSWHPSTMRNMEKVWKAEQKHDQEKKRIAELQREIQQEKALEDIKKFGEETGVLEKKDECKLEWMYKGPHSQVNREEYLLGRSIDKNFEQVQEAEKSSFLSGGISERDASNSTSSNFITPATHQVDLARKLQEDPLFAIKKKEIECRSQILNNPVKLKKLKQYLESRNEKKSKRDKKNKKKKHKKKDSSDSDGDDDLDAMLLAKYKKLKKKLNKSDIETLKTECDSSDSEDEVDSRSHESKRSKDQGREDSKRQRSDNKNSQTWKKPSEYSHHKPNGENSFRYKRDSVGKQDSKPAKAKMSEEEMERRRAEMMDNAKWRERERERNIARHKAEEAREKDQSKNYDKDFLRKQLAHAASQGTVESRIRSNINNIQRSSVAMDKNFARR